METVLVTGGSGAIARWCIIELLQRGYTVRTTVRDLAREPEVRSAIAKEVDPGDRLTFGAADLLRDDGWTEAVAGCSAVLHVASPFPPAQPKNPDDLIVPAREGTLRVLRASVAAGVSRVVVTSSAAAIAYTKPPASGVYTEDEWSDPAYPGATPYVQSKTIAERAAWDFMKNGAGATTMSVVNPGAVIGPVAGEDPSYSFQAVSRVLAGELPALPRLGFSFVDVRDIADLHIRAMTTPAAAGERFLGVAAFLWFAEIAKILRERLGPEARKVPKLTAPDALIRLVALFDPSIRSVISDLGVRTDFSHEKATRLLGWTPRPIEDTVVDCAQSLIQSGIVKV
jgi:nucleoside-diphosphate-sugar epimerase